MNAPAIRYADIAIVGGGLGGLVAAVTACRQLGGGADVIVLEGSDPEAAPAATSVRASCSTVDHGRCTSAVRPRRRSPLSASTSPPADRRLRRRRWHGPAAASSPCHKVRPTCYARRCSAGVPCPDGPAAESPRAPRRRVRTREHGRRVGSTSLRLGADAAALVHMLVRVATYTNAPHLVEASAAIANLNTAFGPGVRYLDGGWQTLIDQLHRRAGEAGVDVCGDVAVSVEPDGDMTLVTTTAGQVAPAAAVVLAAGSAANCTALLGHVPDGWDVSSQPANIACLKLGLRRPPAHPWCSESTNRCTCRRTVRRRGARAWRRGRVCAMV